MEARRRDNEAYLAAHPELADMLAEFVAGALRDRPQDVRAFAAAHFLALAQQPPASTLTTTTTTAGGRQHAPLVVVGPSGVGKGTLIKRLMDEFKDAMGFSVSHTTRAPRAGEAHGVHYNFTTHDDMRREIAAGRFIEYAEVHGNIYGTSIQAISAVRQKGLITVLDIDVQGMEAMKRTDLSPNTLYIAPPSHDELEKRLRKRGSESEDAITKRLANAHGEIQHLSRPGVVHHTIVNDDLDRAYSEFRAKILTWYPHLDTKRD